MASWAVVGLSLLSGDDRRVRGPEVLGRPRDLETADAAVDVVVGPDGQDVDVDAPLAVLATQAVLVVNPSLDVYLLGLKELEQNKDVIKLGRNPGLLVIRGYR